MILKLLPLLLCLIFTVNAVEKARFDNYRVYQVKIENERQLNLMLHIQEHSDSVRRRNIKI